MPETVDEFNIPGWDLTPVEDTAPATLAYFAPKADEYFATAAQPVLDTMPPEWAEGDYEEDYCDCPLCTGQVVNYDGLNDGEAVEEEEILNEEIPFAWIIASVLGR